MLSYIMTVLWTVLFMSALHYFILEKRKRNAKQYISNDDILEPDKDLRQSMLDAAAKVKGNTGYTQL